MRLIAPARLSRVTDDSNSVDTQAAACEAWAAGHGHEIVASTADLNISGGVPIRDRPGVGPWLAPARLAEWDGLLLHTLDRGFRDQLDFLEFYRDVCVGQDKVLIVVDDDIDSSTRLGKRLLNQRASAAEEERERMSDRRQRAQDKIRADGRWGGGHAPYGYRPAKAAGRGWLLEPDPEQAGVVRRLAAGVISGRSCGSLAAALNAEGIRTRDGGQWRAATVLRLMRTPVIRGHVLHYPPRDRKKGGPAPAAEVVRGPDGMPVQRAPLIDDETWRELQVALDRNASPGSGVRDRASLLLQVAFCGECERPLYYDRQRRRGGRLYEAYRCSRRRAEPRCPAGGIPAGDLEAAVVSAIMAGIGDVERVTRVREPGEDHAADLAQVGEAIAALHADRYQRGLFRGAEGAAEYAEVMTGLESRRAHLQSLPARAPGWRLERTGQTYRQHWEGLDDDGRRAFLLQSGITVLAWRLDGQVTIGVPRGLDVLRALAGA